MESGDRKWRERAGLLVGDRVIVMMAKFRMKTMLMQQVPLSISWEQCSLKFSD